MKIGLVALALAGCVAEPFQVADIPVNTPRVIYANVGANPLQTGSTTIYQGDVAVFFFDVGTGLGEQRLVTLRSGGYDRLRAAALAEIEALEEAVGTGQQCDGYGRDRIEVWDGPEESLRVVSGCPDNAVTQAQARLRRMVAAETVE